MSAGVGFSNVYTSCACNRTPHSAHWGNNNLVCFGTSHAVAIYDPEYLSVGAITTTLSSHSGRVNCVRWVRDRNDAREQEIISCSCDGTAILWSKNEEGLFKVKALLEGHKNSVTVADAMYVSPDIDAYFTSRKLIAVTGSVDSTVRIWLREEGESQLSCFQIVECGSGFALCLKVCNLPNTSQILLLCSTDDAKVHLYVSNLNKLFTKVQSLIGHEDWVRSLDVVECADKLIVASGSQDTMIRLWYITSVNSTLDSAMSDADEIKPEEKLFSVEEHQFAITMESVLTGHEGWIYSVCWHSMNDSSLSLLSASIDKSIIIWSPDPLSGVWLEKVRVGDVGGNNLGFYGGMFSPDGLNILGHGYQGSFHRWTFSSDSNSWEPKVVSGGHFDEVIDFQWEPNGSYLLSVSKDQTTRLHSPWIHPQNKNEITWHEIARPQIHGYDLSCVAILKPNKFASGAEEKIIRAFQAPMNFIENFERLSGIKLKNLELDNIARGASVPALGLSNKAVFEIEEMPEDRHVKDEFPAAYFIPVELREPPPEEHLMQNTLWPEVQKLYGHGYEIFSLAAHPSGLILASACKSTTTEHASIILWNALTWQKQQVLVSHQLTVTQMAFSPNGKYLLSVSRDRSWSLFQDLEQGYELISKTNKKTGIHARIIWTCAWSSDSKYFATGSRDGKLCVWLPQCGEPKNLSVLEIKGASITAVAFQPQSDEEKYAVAVGLESGEILLYSLIPISTSWEKMLHLSRDDAHHLTVSRLAFSPGDPTQLASCSIDGCVKIYQLCKS